MKKLDINEMFNLIKREFRIVIISVLVFTLAASGVTLFLTKPRYEVSTKVFVGKEKFVNTSEVYTNDEVIMYQRTLKTYTEVIKSRDMMEAVIKASGEKLEVTEALAKVEIVTIADTQILQFKYNSTNKEEAYNMCYALAEQFIKVAKLLYPKGNIQVIEQPAVPIGPINSSVPINIGLGAFIGLVAGGVFIFLREYMDNTVKNKEDLEYLLGLPTIGVIPNHRD